MKINIFNKVIVGMFMLGVGFQVFAAPLPNTIKKKLETYQSPIGGDYIIGVDDRVQVSVWRNPDLSVTVPVRPDGKISVPLVGDVLAAGLTPPELAALITAKLENYIRNPQVSVILTGLNSNEYASRVRITGAVRQPLSVPHRDGMTVLDLLVSAGGVDEFASANRATLYRKEEKGGYKEIQLKLNNLLKKGDLKYNLELQAGDVITVPERLF